MFTQGQTIYIYILRGKKHINVYPGANIYIYIYLGANNIYIKPGANNIHIYTFTQGQTTYIHLPS